MSARALNKQKYQKTLFQATSAPHQLRILSYSHTRPSINQQPSKQQSKTGSRHQTQSTPPLREAPTMSSTASCPYTHSPPRTSQIATRNLISPSPDQSSQCPCPDNSCLNANAGKTDHYERAAAEATTTGALPSTTASSAAAAVGSQDAQGWKVSDLRAQKQGEVVEGRAGGTGMGYSTTMQR